MMARSPPDGEVKVDPVNAVGLQAGVLANQRLAQAPQS